MSDDSRSIRARAPSPRQPDSAARSAPRPVTLDQLHEAAAGVLDELGWDLFTMQDLAERVGRSRQALYLRCGSRGNVLIGVVRLFFRRIADELVNVDPRAGVDQLAQRLARGFRDRSSEALARVALWAKDMPGVAEDVAREQERWRHLLLARPCATNSAACEPEGLILELLRQQVAHGAERTHRT